MPSRRWIWLVVAVVVAVVLNADPHLFAQNSNGIITFQTDQQTFNNLVANSGNATKIQGFPINGSPSSGASYPCWQSNNTIGWCAGGGGGGVTFSQDLTGNATAQQVVGISHVTTGTLGIPNGGTNATSAAGARTALGAAQSGVNADITQATSLPLNGLATPSANYNMNGHTLIGATPASTPGMPIIQAQPAAALHDLNPNPSSASLQYIGAFLGIGFSVNGAYNPTDPFFGADPTGTNDSGLAISKAIATAIYNTQNALSAATSARTDLPAGIYLVNEPVLLPSSELSALSSGAAPVQLFGASKYATVLKNNMVGGPVLVPMSGWAIPSANNGNPIKQAALVTGSSGSAQWASNGSGEWSIVLQELLNARFMNGFTQADVRGFYKPANVAGSLEVLSSSMGAISKWNCTQDSVIQPDGSGACIGAYAAYRNTSGNLVCQFNLSTSGLVKATSAGTFTVGSTNEFECSYNGSDVYAILNGTASLGTAGTGTIVQGEYETTLIGGSVGVWPLIEWSYWPAGNIDSFEIANVARNTSNYTQHTTAYPGDTHSTVLFDGFGTNLNLPSTLAPSGTWPWAFGPSYLNGSAVNETSSHAWVEAKTTGIGCCGGDIEIGNLQIEGGTEGIASQVGRLDVHGVDLNVQSYIGAETTSGSYASKFNDVDIYGYNGGTVEAMGLVLSGGISYASQIVLGYGDTAGYGGVWLGSASLRDSYISMGSGTLQDIVCNGSCIVDNINEDNESGGTFAGFTLSSDPKQATSTFALTNNVIEQQGSGVAPITSDCNNFTRIHLGYNIFNVQNNSLTTEVDSTHCNANTFNAIDFDNDYFGEFSDIPPTGVTYTNHSQLFRSRGLVNIPPIFTTSTLPHPAASPVFGSACVSDATACTSGTTYTGGASDVCMLSWNGTNWIETGLAYCIGN